MSDHRRLIGKLLTMAATDASIQDGWRLIGDPLDRDPLASILREIDETQLPRVLSFRNDQGHMLRLEAGNRRLRRIVSISWSDPGAVADLSEKDLSKATEAKIEAIGAALRTVQPGERTVHVHSEDLSGTSAGSGNGILAATLARTWSIDLERRADEDLFRAFEEFVETLKPLATAWLRFENGVVSEASDPEPDAAWRDGWSAIDLSKFRNGNDPIDAAPVLCIFGNSPERETSHIVAGIAETQVVFLTKAAKISEIAQRWRDLGL